jgi:FkbM family methyltransferase
MKWRGKIRPPGFPVLDKDDAFHTIARQDKDLVFVEIGAYDGVQNDPVHSFVKTYRWVGVVVEPNPKAFAALKENYRGQPGISLENVAISNSLGERMFYYLPSEYSEPNWLQQIGTFERHAIELNLAALPELLPKVQTKMVKTITLAELVRRNRVPRIDLLIVDAEGMEWEIISQISELASIPKYILFEWTCLAQEALAKLVTFLRNQHYEMYSCGPDALAVLS